MYFQAYIICINNNFYPTGGADPCTGRHQTIDVNISVTIPTQLNLNSSYTYQISRFISSTYMNLLPGSSSTSIDVRATLVMTTATTASIDLEIRFVV